MGKVEAVAAMIAAVQAGQAQAMSDAGGALYDQAALDQKGIDGSFSQADIDKAVADAQAVDAKAMADAKAASDAALVDLQGKLDALAAKEGQEAGVIKGLQASKDALAAALKTISDLLPAV